MAILRKISTLYLQISLCAVCFAQTERIDSLKMPILGNPVFAATKPDSLISSVLISDVFVGKVSYFDLKNIPYNGQIISEIQLKYYENSFTLFCSTKDFQLGDTLTFSCRLEGFHNNWVIRPSYTYRKIPGQQLQNGQQIQQVVSYRNLTPGKYVFHARVKKSNEGWRKNEAKLIIVIAPALWQTWWFWLSVIAGLSFLIFLIVRLRVNAVRKQERLRAKHEKEVLQLEMQALRAQMNPHFIFNSLNSINRFILQNNKAQASEYLTKFSKLVRMILQNSQASLITLESELEALKLYLEMEELRFNYHFDYKIAVPKDLDIEMLKVPPLIIQPYAENAIWHGLMHKEEKGQLDIEVSQENNYLFFKITDDGVGRKQSAMLASKSATKHKSMGLRITADRIAMMQNTNGNESPVTINDLINADGSAAGTEVIIKMPVLYD